MLVPITPVVLQWRLLAEEGEHGPESESQPTGSPARQQDQLLSLPLLTSCVEYLLGWYEGETGQAIPKWHIAGKSYISFF